MPNQNNFRSDVTNITDTTYLASRIVQFPTDAIFLEQVAGSFGYDPEDNLELHFYSVPDNELVLSTVVKLSDDMLKFNVVSYEDGTYKTYLRIDMTKLVIDKNLILVSGDYRLVVNFFSDEIGSYVNRKMFIAEISDSRTEVELQFIDNQADRTGDLRILNQVELKEFVEKGFTRPDAIGVGEKIFKSGVELNDPTEGVTSTNIITNIEIPLEQQTFDNTITRIQRLGLRIDFEQQLNDFVQTLYPLLREKIVRESDERIQESEFRDFIIKLVEQKISNLAATVDARIKIR